MAHPGVDKIAFTGSTEVGRILRTQTAGTGKKLSLELGGKSPFLVYEDADLDSVVEGVVDAIWFNQGQVCCAGSRILVQEGVAGARWKRSSGPGWRPSAWGIPLDKSVDMGADRRPGPAGKDPESGGSGPRAKGPRSGNRPGAAPRRAPSIRPRSARSAPPASTWPRWRSSAPSWCS